MFLPDNGAKAPCFDAKTKTDCPSRSLACHVTCEEWAAYEERRSASYMAKNERISKKCDLEDFVERTIDRHRRRNHGRN